MVDDCDEVGDVLSMTCGVEGCEDGGVNCDSGGVLCIACGDVGGGGGGGVPSSSSGSVLVSVGDIGGEAIEAGSAAEFEVSSCASVTVTGGDCEALRAFEELAFPFPLPPDLPLPKGSLCLIPLKGQYNFLLFCK